MAVSLLSAYSSIGPLLSAFQSPSKSDSAWRKLPDWSTSTDTAAAFADSVGTATINSYQALARLKASQGLARIRAAAAAKKAAQDATAAKLRSIINNTTAASGGTSVSGPQYGGLSTSVPVSSKAGSAAGPRFDFTA